MYQAVKELQFDGSEVSVPRQLAFNVAIPLTKSGASIHEWSINLVDYLLDRMNAKRCEKKKCGHSRAVVHCKNCGYLCAACECREGKEMKESHQKTSHFAHTV